MIRNAVLAVTTSTVLATAAFAAPTQTVNVDLAPGTITTFSVPAEVSGPSSPYQPWVLNFNGAQSTYDPGAIAQNHNIQVAELNVDLIGALNPIFDFGGTSFTADTITFDFTASSASQVVGFSQLATTMSRRDADVAGKMIVNSPNADFTLAGYHYVTYGAQTNFLDVKVLTGISATTGLRYFEIQETGPQSWQYRTSPTAAFTGVAVPEPTSLAAAGLLGLGALVRRRSR